MVAGVRRDGRVGSEPLRDRPTNTSYSSRARRPRRQAEIEIARLERVLVLAQRRIVRRQRHREAGRQAAVEQAGALQLVEARQVADRLEPEMARNASVVPKVSGRPGALRRPRGRIQPVSSSTSSVPFDTDTPRMSSISARVTGW